MSQKWKPRGTALLTAAVLGLGGIAAAISAATAYATTPGTAATCTRYVVTAPAAVEVWIDPDSTVPDQRWNKLPPGNVFCAYERNVAGTRFRVQYNCHPAQNCNPVGPYTGWVTTDPQAATPVNCTVRTLTRQVTVFTNPSTEEAWTTWPSGTSFCDFGQNSTGTRFQVYVYCSLPACHRPEGTWVGWVSSNPIYYGSPAPQPPCRPWPAPCTALPTLTALPE